MPRPAKPPSERRGRAKPVRGEWRASPGVGWQYGRIPEPPDGLLAVSRDTWTTWMKAWFASNWTEADLPGLALVIAQYDAVNRDKTGANDMTALVRLMDTYGITPKGQQDRRWSPPKQAEESESQIERPAAQNPYAGLRVVKSA